MSQAPRTTDRSGIIPYEERLNASFSWALNEGGMHFEKESEVHKSLRRITQRLDRLEIPYAVAGGMAMYYYGYRRFTEDVDIVVTHEGLRTIHEKLEGLGYLPPFPGSKQLRDTESGVRIEFLITGTYPGDGLPKPVQFPDPSTAHTEIEGMSFLNLEQLVELKLISGMVPGRLKDLGDVQELIRMLPLSRDFQSRLHPYVQPMFDKMWEDVQRSPVQP